MNLYEIDREILGCVDMETGEIIDDGRLDRLQMEKEKKIENIACWYKNLKAEEGAIDSEIKNLNARKVAAGNQAERLKEYLSGYLDGEKFKTARISISYRKSESVVIEDTSNIPTEYLVTKEPEPSKTKIKEAIKGGLTVPGAHIEQKQNIQIK